MKKSIKDCITRMEMQRATKCLDAATAEHLTIEVIQTAGRHFERLTLNQRCKDSADDPTQWPCKSGCGYPECPERYDPSILFVNCLELALDDWDIPLPEPTSHTEWCDDYKDYVRQEIKDIKKRTNTAYRKGLLS